MDFGFVVQPSFSDGESVTVTGKYERILVEANPKTLEQNEIYRRSSRVVSVFGFVLCVYWDSKQWRSEEEIAEFEDKIVEVKGIFHNKTPPRVVALDDGSMMQLQTKTNPYISVKSIHLKQ
jgi:hypothetical protein